MQTPLGGPAWIANAVGAGGREEHKHRRSSRESSGVRRCALLARGSYVIIAEPFDIVGGAREIKKPSLERSGS